ncbi:hypothetical protein [uncultured Croceitalea sp.]|uniref:hypothetical protein n=1 Tax=uncultured Croceitalea sp. TaxID=1798908 RepID=UPI003305C96C
MKKNLLLYILLGFLVLMNGFFLFNHFSKSGRSDPRRLGSANFISKQLEFDVKQTQQFKDLEVVHREKMRSLLDDLRELKSKLFEKLSDDTVNPSEIDAITTLIGDKEKAKELETFRFFREVVEMCNKNQKEQFTSIIKGAMHHKGPARGNRPPRGRPSHDGMPPPPQQ